MGMFENFNLCEGFHKYFRIGAAATRHQHDEAFRIRHGVYCEDLAYEPARSDGRETDPHDAHSLQCILRTRSDPPQPVGCTRLVLTDPADRDAPLPFEETCRDALDRSIINPAKLPRDTIAEVSRLAVIRQFRRRRGEQGEAAPLHTEDFGTPGQPRFPYIPLSLYFGAVALADMHGIRTIFVLTEPRLAAHFAKLGVEIRQIGAPVEHRGMRVPSMLDVQSIGPSLRVIVQPLFYLIRAEIEEGERATHPW